MNILSKQASIEALPTPSPEMSSRPMPPLKPGQDFSGMDLSGKDLSGLDLSTSDFSGANLQGANLQGTILYKSNLDNGEFLMANLEGADLTEVSAENVGFGHCDLTNAIFFSANLRNASFTSAKLHGADFRVACLAGARFRDTDLTDASFVRADMQSTDLTAADVSNSSFDEADLRQARVKLVTGFEHASWIGTDIQNVDFCGAYRMRRTIMDQNYLHEFRNRSKTSLWMYRLWWLTSDCGRSIARWASFTLVLAIAFGIAYSQLDLTYTSPKTALSPFYFSIVTLTTLGYGDVFPTSTTAQVVVMLEVVVGYVMLGGLLSIFSENMGRRAT